MPKDELLAPRYSPVPGLWDEQPLAPEIDEIAAGSFTRRERPEIKGSGYVVRSLEAALWAIDSSDGFREGALFAVNLGGDADTTGAVYGQLAGALYGEDSIPAERRESSLYGRPTGDGPRRLASSTAGFPARPRPAETTRPNSRSGFLRGAGIRFPPSALDEVAACSRPRDLRRDIAWGPIGPG